MQTTADLGLRWNRTRFNPLANLTPESLTRSLDYFDRGIVRPAAVLWEQILERDDVLSIAAPKRLKAVSRCKWSVLTLDDSPEADRHQETLIEFYNNLRATSTIRPAQRGGTRLLFRQLASAAFYGDAVHEIVWDTQERRNGRNALPLRAEFRFVPLYFFECETGAPRYLGPEYAKAEGQPLPWGEWLVTAGDSAIMKAASICYLFKKFSLTDWLNFGAKFGIPGIHGETQAQPGSPEWQKFVDALDSFANDWIIATSMGDKINLIEAAKGGGDVPFAPMVERMDRRLAALCRGADLSTLSAKEQTGASLQGDEQDILVEDDCAMISEALMEVSRFVILYIHGTDPLAYIQLMPPVKKEIQQEVAVDTFLMAHGGELGAAETYERYGREMPDSMPEDAVLKAPQSALSAFPGEPKPAHSQAARKEDEDEDDAENDDPPPTPENPAKEEDAGADRVVAALLNGNLAGAVDIIEAALSQALKPNP